MKHERKTGMRKKLTALKTNEIFSVVIPCHNSALLLRETISSILVQLEKAKNDNKCEKYEIVAIENGSTDNTFEILCDIEKKLPRGTFKLFRTAKGLGNALRKGIFEANGTKVAFVADDLPHITQEIELMCDQDLLKTSDLVFLSKYNSPINYGRKPVRILAGMIFANYRNFVLSMELTDTQGTFVGEMSKIKEICSRTIETGFVVTCEIALLAKISNLVIKEVPILCINERRERSTVDFIEVLKMLLGVLKIRYRFKNKIYLS